MKSLYLAGMLLLVGCNGQTLKVGNDGTAGGSSNANSTTDLATELGAVPICDTPVVNAPDANWPAPVACVAAATEGQSSIVGVWEGDLEDEYCVPSGKEFHVEILAAAPGGVICGTARRGPSSNTVRRFSNHVSAARFVLLRWHAFAGRW